MAGPVELQTGWDSAKFFQPGVDLLPAQHGELALPPDAARGRARLSHGVQVRFGREELVAGLALGELDSSFASGPASGSARSSRPQFRWIRSRGSFIVASPPRPSPYQPKDR